MVEGKTNLERVVLKLLVDKKTRLVRFPGRNCVNYIRQRQL